MNAISWGAGEKLAAFDATVQSLSASRRPAEFSFPPCIVDQSREARPWPDVSNEDLLVPLKGMSLVEDAVSYPVSVHVPQLHSVDWEADTLQSAVFLAKYVFAKLGEEAYCDLRGAGGEAVSSSIESIEKSLQKIFSAANIASVNRQPTPAERLQERLKGLLEEAVGEHPDPDSRYPTPRAFTDAREFASCLDLNSYGLPMVNMAGDGEINFFWHRESDGLRVDLGVYGTGTYSYYGRRGDQEVFADDLPVEKGLADDLAALLLEG